MIGLPQPYGHGLSGAVQSGHDCALGDSQNSSDFLIGKMAVFPQDKDFLELVGQITDRSFQEPDLSASKDFRLWSFRFCGVGNGLK